MFKGVLQKLMDHQPLTQKESYEAMQNILEGQISSAQISSFMTLLTFRGVETEELTGLALAMRDHAMPVDLSAVPGPIVDTCGTGGDGLKTFNISTASAIVAATSGMNVAKHGNRSVSSLSGSADVLECLGLDVEVEAAQIREALNKQHMCFMFAPLYHQAMKHVSTARKEVGFRSVFNLLGPLTNPAGATRQVIGVYDESYSMKMAQTLRALGSEHVLIVKGQDGMDEFSIQTETHVTELKYGEITAYTVRPEDVGLVRHDTASIQVRNAQESAALIRHVLKREMDASCAGLTQQKINAARDVVAFNAGAALYVGGKALDLRSGVRFAHQLLQTGAVEKHYEQMMRHREERRHAEPNFAG